MLSVRKQIGSKLAALQPPEIVEGELLDFSAVTTIDSDLLENLPTISSGSPSILSPRVWDFRAYLLGSTPLRTIALAQLNLTKAQSFNIDSPFIPLQNFSIGTPLENLTITSSLFQIFAHPKIYGMNYQDRQWRQITRNNEGRTVVKNEYQPTFTHLTFPKEVETKPEKKSKPKIPSFWDLLYAILQPPIIIQQLENIFLPHALYPYQPLGIQFLMQNEGALLADEMGTGKTVMTSLAIRIIMQKAQAKHALIVCPLSVLRQWQQHLDEWAPELIVRSVRSNREARRIEWEIPAHVYLTTYDTLRSDIESGILPQDKQGIFDIVVLDEAQNIKEPSSKRSRAVKKLKARHRWALTGTPVENKVDDMVSLFSFLRPGYLTPFDLYPARLKEKIAPYFLRRRKVDVLPDLLPMQKQDVWLELDDVQRQAYERILQGARQELTALGARVTKVDIFRNLTRLKQICNFAPEKKTSPKLDTLKEQVEEIAASGQKLIVFSQYLSEGIDKLEEALSPYGTAKIVGGQTESQRNGEVERFKKSVQAPILLASIRAGGVGLNLTEASYVVHFDHWWNPAVMWQAEARVHRVGQERGVNVYSYWIADTIEVNIHRKLEEKGLLFKDIVDGLSDTEIDNLISTDEWLEIFGVKTQEQRPRAERQTLNSLSVSETREKLLVISPSQFEHLVKDLMISLGYSNVKVTGRRGDGGIDVISSRITSEGTVRAVAQCKRYKGTVGVDIARELLGVLTLDKSIEKGFLVTTGEFTQECIAVCERSGVIATVSGAQMANYVKVFGLNI